MIFLNVSIEGCHCSRNGRPPLRPRAFAGKGAEGLNKQIIRG